MADEEVTPRKYGPYESVEDLEKGYAASSQEAQRLKAERDQLAAKALAYEQQFQAMQPRQPQAQSPWEQLESIGVPQTALREALREEIQGVFAPIAKSLEARPKILAEYPDYNEYETKVNQWINADPNRAAKYNRTFLGDPQRNMPGDPEMAMEWAILKYGQSARGDSQQNGEPEKAQKRERSQAQIPSGRTGESRRAATGDQSELAEKWQEFQKTKDPSAYVKARLRAAIPDKFFEQG